MTVSDQTFIQLFILTRHIGQYRDMKSVVLWGNKRAQLNLNIQHSTPLPRSFAGSKVGSIITGQFHILTGI